MPLSEQEAKTISQKLLSSVQADDAMATLRSDTYQNVRFAANRFTTNGRSEDLEASVTVWVEGRKGTAQTNEIDDSSLETAVRQAEELARLSPVDQEYLPTLGPQMYKPTNSYAEATPNISLTARTKVISDTIAACEKQHVVGAGFHQARGSARSLATKHGNFSYERSSLASFSVTARTEDGAGSGYFLRNHFDVTKLDTARVSREAIQKALASRHARTLAADNYTVILEAQAVADLLSFLQFSFDARNADEGRSAFSAPGGKTRSGEPIFDERISFYSDPWHDQFPGSQMTQEGIPAQKFYLVREGVLENLVYTRFWAKEKEKEASPGPVNFLMESSQPAASVDAMLADTERGLLVTRFWYLRMVEPRTLLITGATRDGVWYIEKGKIQYPVRNFRFNQSVLGMLSPGNIDMIGASERVGWSEAQGSNSSFLPALKVKQFHFTSQSDAI